MTSEEILGHYQECIDEIATHAGEASRGYEEYALGWYTAATSRFADLLPGMALDAGCRCGTMSMFLRKLGWAVMAVDIECYMPKEIMRTYGIVFAYADLDIPPTHFPVSPCFDLILASQVLEHLNFNPLPALQWFRDCLLPGGFLVLTTPDADRYPDIPDLPTARRMPWREIPEYDPGVPREHGHHSKQYTAGQLNDLLTAAGFRLEPITRFEAQGGHLLAVGRC